MVAGSELTYNNNAPALQMANEIFGSSVTVVGASCSGSIYSSAMYSNGVSISDFVTQGDTGVILFTVRALHFIGSSSQSKPSANTTTNTGGANNDSDFNSIAGASAYDASFMVVDFIPDNDTMTMQFVFSSEEYPEYTNSIYNDAVGVWVNGTQTIKAFETEVCDEICEIFAELGLTTSEGYSPAARPLPKRVA